MRNREAESGKMRERHAAVTRKLPSIVTLLHERGARDVARTGGDFDPDYQFILSTTGYVQAAADAIRAGKITAYALMPTGMGGYSLEIEVAEGGDKVRSTYNATNRRLKSAQII